MKRNDPVQIQLINYVQVYRFICLAVSIAFITQSGNWNIFSFQYGTGYIVYFILGALCSWTARRRPIILMSLSMLDYFAVLLYSYFGDHTPFMEFLWLPGILTQMALVLDFPANIITVLILGIPGPLIFSYVPLSGQSLPMKEHLISVIDMYLLFFIPLSLLASGIGIFRIKAERLVTKYKKLEILKSQLDKINRNITMKMFTLRNDSTLEERKRISREVHDTAGYVFINLIMMLQAASAVLPRDSAKAGELIRDARDYASRGINEIRHILQEIRNYNPAALSLQNELYDTAKSFRNATAVKVVIDFGNWPETFSPNMDSFFISFLQEALTNALKHGNASAVNILCWLSPGHIIMSISDNGKGAALPLKTGIGISSVEDFLKAVNGRMNIKSGESGFSISLEIPRESLKIGDTLP